MDDDIRFRDWKVIVLNKTSDTQKYSRNYRKNNNIRRKSSGNKKINDNEDFKAPQSIDVRTSQIISKARTKKGWTQKELAVKMNEKVSVIQNYESGKAIPSQKLLSKFKRVLDCNFD